MSTPRQPVQARLLVSALMQDKSLMPAVIETLSGRYGPIDRMTDWLPFDYTGYYASEMGTDLCRRVITFEQLIDQERLPDIKLFTNRMETEGAENGRRRINLDPGYLTPERLILGTGKNFSHRVYLRDGIFADLTLIYTQSDFQAMPWTYPDYSDERMKAFLREVRQEYMQILKRTPT